MKFRFAGLLVLFAWTELVWLAPPAHAARNQLETVGVGRTVTLDGQIVDVACYIGFERKAVKHEKCTKSCLLDGSPIGLVTSEGTLYLLLEDPADRQDYQLVKKAPVERVRISGKTFTKGGIQALVVSRVDAQQPAAAGGCTDHSQETATGEPGYCQETP